MIDGVTDGMDIVLCVSCVSCVCCVLTPRRVRGLASGGITPLQRTVAIQLSVRCDRPLCTVQNGAERGAWGVAECSISLGPGGSEAEWSADVVNA